MELMIDIETLGVSTKCPIISIGAVFFDKDGLKDEFYVILNTSEQIDGCRKVDSSTIKWWMEQENAAQKIFKEEGIGTKEGLLSFREFCGKYEDIKPWGNGPTFDITILESIFSDYDVDVPWKFNNIRCLRTFKEYVTKELKVERVGVYHNALDDAKHQARVVIESIN